VRALALLVLMVFPTMAVGATTVLENQYIRVEISSENGSIVSILNKKTGTNYIADPAQAKLFRFLIPVPDYLSRRINSWDQKVESISSKNDSVEIRYHDLQISREKYFFQSGTIEVPEPKLDIEVTVTLRLDGKHILGNMQVDNRSLEEITDVTFPWIGGLIRNPNGKQAKVVIPSLSDKILPHGPSFLLGELFKRYPALLATSWVNYDLPGESLGIEAQSPPETQDAYVSPAPNLLSLNSPSYAGPSGLPYIAWNFFPHIPAHGHWTSPQVVIHVHDADWHTIAGEHRDWYRKTYSPTESAAFNGEIGFATYRLKKNDGTVNWTYDEIPKLAQQAELAGIKDVVIEGWRDHEGTGNHVPFEELADPRMGGGAKLKSLVESLHEKGIELIFAFHPAKMDTVSKQYQEGASRWTVKTRRQANQLPPAYTFYTYDYPYYPSTYHYWAVVDPSSPATDYLLDQARRLRDEDGFRNLFLRGVGLESFLSYNHWDPVPPQEVYENGYSKFLGGIKELYPNGILMMEGFNDLVNKYSSVGYTWDQSENPEILAYSLPWIPFSNDIEALDYGKANGSFAHKVLINLLVDGGDGTVGRYPDFAKHLAALEKLKEATAPYYADAECYDHDGLKAADETSGVVISTFKNRASGQMGIVVANMTKDAKTASFELAKSSADLKGKLFRLSGGAEKISLSSKVSVSLGPYEVAIVGIDQ
jgi:Glycosyl hydrolases family 38 C-terminal domain